MNTILQPYFEGITYLFHLSHYWVSMFISCAEVLQLNILIYDFLSFAKMWMTFHNASSRMVCHQCGFFRVASNDMIGCFWSHTGCIWMVYHQCAFFRVSSMHLSTCIHTGSSWMVYPQCGFFHISLNGLTLHIWSHTRSNWMVWTVACLFTLLDVEEWEQLNGLSPFWVLSCASSKSIHLFCLPCWKLNLHIGIKCCS